MNTTTFPDKPQTTPPPAGTATLDRSLQYVSGVGPVRAKSLAHLGLHTVGDLLRHYPRAHEDRRLKKNEEWGAPGTAVAVVGTVKDFQVSGGGKDLLIGRAVLGREGKPLEALWFRRRSFRFDPFDGLKKKLLPGTSVFVYGPWQYGSRGLEIRVEDHDFPTGGPSPHMDRLVPIYDLTEGLDGKWLRAMVWKLRDAVAEVPDVLPTSVRKKCALSSGAEALSEFHFPSDPAVLGRARRRLAFDEFFSLELALARVRQVRDDGPPAPISQPTRALLTPFRKALGFDFTSAQKRVINEIFSDMALARPMNRLLMGEVGSGKTVVAVSALLLAVEAGRQAVLMAPTEILAEQHAHGLARILKGLPLRWALLTGGRKKSESRLNRDALASGDIHIVVGTHALLEDQVAFKNLGLVVIDEQHRFGVDQRATLGAKGVSPHVLLMTATPIPRTLALTVYGDLSVSVIDQLPPGRPVITTHWSKENDALSAVRRAVAQGRQAYVVFPLVQESERLDLKAVLKGWEHLKTAFPDIPVGLLHGKLKSAEKEAAMAAFARGELKILAATPVIEVGIDVANATVLVVMNAERFGLAQLHQLRGRIGRGVHPSSCHLVSDAPSADAAERLNLLCTTKDGFKLAEEDLRRRGPGEFLGEAQHGLPEFRVGNLATDGPLIAEAREAAFALIKDDPTLTHPDHRAIADDVTRRFSHRFRFGKVA
jgi:ATP-dependent DNA helicase RecG